ncbi:hypothetical protein MXB_3876 [Myxobolus squamalis]|nr:hypothetical protein MXB_3876 [Myxobolus squamalis]
MKYLQNLMLLILLNVITLVPQKTACGEHGSLDNGNSRSANQHNVIYVEEQTDVKESTSLIPFQRKRNKAAKNKSKSSKLDN